MKILLLLPSLITTAFTAAQAHNGTLKGRVNGKDDSTPIAGASIMMRNTGKGTTTDLFGVYTFNDLPEGSYKLQLSYLGYAPVTKTVAVKANETTFITSYLEESDFHLAEVSIAANQKQPLSTISTVDINLRPAQWSQDVLRLIPGLFIAQHAGGGKAEQIFLRGFDIDHGTDIRLTVDGMPVNMISHAHG